MPATTLPPAAPRPARSSQSRKRKERGKRGIPFIKGDPGREGPRRAATLTRVVAISTCYAIFYLSGFSIVFKFFYFSFAIFSFKVCSLIYNKTLCPVKKFVFITLVFSPHRCRMNFCSMAVGVEVSSQLRLRRSSSCCVALRRRPRGWPAGRAPRWSGPPAGL